LIKRYSSFQVQLVVLGTAPSTPAPAVQPVLFVVLANPHDKGVHAGGPLKQLSVIVPEAWMPPKARPLVPYNRVVGVMRIPTRARRAKPVERDLHGPTDGRAIDIAIDANAVGIAETGAAPFAKALDIGLKAKNPSAVSLPIVTDL
jgi:hypothetical protein